MVLSIAIGVFIGVCIGVFMKHEIGVSIGKKQEARTYG